MAFRPTENEFNCFEMEMHWPFMQSGVVGRERERHKWRVLQLHHTPPWWISNNNLQKWYTGAADSTLKTATAKLVLYRANVITLITRYFTFGLINIRLKWHRAYSKQTPVTPCRVSRRHHWLEPLILSFMWAFQFTFTSHVHFSVNL